MYIVYNYLLLELLVGAGRGSGLSLGVGARVALGLAQILTRVVTRSSPMHISGVGWLVAARSLY